MSKTPAEITVAIAKALSYAIFTGVVIYVFCAAIGLSTLWPGTLVGASGAFYRSLKKDL